VCRVWLDGGRARTSVVFVLANFFSFQVPLSRCCEKAHTRCTIILHPPARTWDVIILLLYPKAGFYSSGRLPILRVYCVVFIYVWRVFDIFSVYLLPLPQAKNIWPNVRQTLYFYIIYNIVICTLNYEYTLIWFEIFLTTV